MPSRSSFVPLCVQKGRFVSSGRLGAEVELGRTHHREKLALDERHAAARPERVKQNAALQAITRKQERKGLGGFLYRATGQARKDEKQATAIRATLQDQDRREAERRQALEVRHGTERAKLSAHHARQDSQLEQRIAHARDKREREGWQDRQPQQDSEQADKQHQAGQDRDQAAAKEPAADRAAEAQKRPQEAANDSGGVREGGQDKATHGAELGKGDSIPPAEAEAAWAAKVEATRAAQEARDRSYGDDTGREMEM